MPATRSTTNNTDGLAFEAVAVTLEVSKGVQKTIVRDARGSVGKHGLLAILGPSGAGKTTLLAALARERPCDAGSKIWRPAGGANFLPQDDRLLPFLTVRETLRFAAELRWDGVDERWDTSAKRAERAESVLETLGLSEVGDTRVGSALKRGVSGGERRRTALGVELVLIPSLLLADEPTSGLDSTAALQLAILLREAEATVVASVHQPGARVFQQFTDVVVLAPGGGTAYAGPADSAASTCASLCKVKVPPLTSAAEVLLDLVDDPATRSILVSQSAPATTRVSHDEDEPQLSTRSRFRPLLTRAWLNNARAPAATVAAVGRSVTMALLVGALYSGSRGTSTQTAVSDRTGALFFVLVNQAFSAMASLRVFIEERSVFEHERRRRAYSTRDYFLAKSLAELPIQGAVALLFAGMAYAMVGLRASLYSFGGHCVVLALATLVAESLVIWVGAGASDARTAVVICPVVLSTSLLFGGLFVSLASLPRFLAPLQYLSLFRYGFAGLLKLEFQHADAVFDCSSEDKELLAQRVIDAGAPAKLLGRLVKSLPCPTPDGETHVKRVLGDDAASRSILMDAGALFALLVAFRVLALRALERRTASAVVVAKAKKA
ncbi:unnamed protein product [Pelagomonas calceolata]|uniref:ABC transporter domain-containing protein n=1 Tax=Pelagomonas calceolata TaxID=35677 RepID=A0A7S4EDP9_9STRA|nr:unnamed protein product [Pelagomonas calceolata]|mmetsp:Transcript_15102/g.42931  ORF Transcript_15102/g.42931 Transcript_15102/m.42931 type:complete len:609 (+) Transcript_15102:216-2042(+)